MSRWRTMRRLAVGVSVVACTVVVVMSVQYARGLWADDHVPTYEVNLQPFVHHVYAEGNLRAVKSTPLVAPRRSQGPSKISWLIADGTRVKQGDLLARFDVTVMEKQLADGRAAQATATRKIARERVMVNAALAERDRASDMSEIELEQAQRFQRKNDMIFSRNDIIESEIDGALSQAKLEHARAAKGIEGSLSQSKLELLQIEQRSADLKVKQAEDGLADLVLTAPHDGIAVLQRDWRGNERRVGDQVWPGQPLVEIPHVEAMEAEVFVLEVDAGGLTEGRSAKVTIEAHPAEVYQGTIKRIDKLARPRIRGVPVQYFGVTLELNKTDTTVMKPGQRVRSTLILDEREAIVVPRPAIFEQDGKTIVYRRRDDGEFDSVAVTLGASSLGRVVVDDGLAIGDRIALVDPTRTSQDKDEDEDSNGEKKATTAARGR